MRPLPPDRQSRLGLLPHLTRSRAWKLRQCLPHLETPVSSTGWLASAMTAGLMPADDLLPILEVLWIWIAAPLTAVAAIAYMVRLKAPQVTRLGEAFRAIRTHDEGSSGSVHPATSAALSAAAAYGAAGAVGAATAVSLGGPGAVAWVWLFTLLLMPLRMGEAALARTAPVGRAGQKTGSLAARLMDDELGGLRAIGWAIFVLVPLAAFAFYGGTHGEAVTDAAEQLLPGSALTLGLVVAGVGGVFAVLPLRQSGSILGWIAAVALIAMFGAGLIAFLSDPGRGFGSFSRAVVDAFDGAPRMSAWSGAVAGEIAVAAMLHILPPVAALGGVDGALHAEAQAETTKKQASVGLLGPLFYGVVVTVVGLSLVATGAFSRPVETSRTLDEVRFYRNGMGPETASQRGELDRTYTGFIRVIDGETGVVEYDVSTDRGLIRTPRYLEGDESADFALHVSNGRADDLQKPGHLGALERRPLEELRAITLHGRMLPEGGNLLAASMTAGGGSITSRVALAALLLLAALGLAAWGLAVARTLSSRLPAATARWTALIPAVGLALAATGAIPGLGAIGSVVAGALAAVVAIALVVRAKDAARIAG